MSVGPATGRRSTQYVKISVRPSDSVCGTGRTKRITFPVTGRKEGRSPVSSYAQQGQRSARSGGHERYGHKHESTDCTDKDRADDGMGAGSIHEVRGEERARDGPGSQYVNPTLLDSSPIPRISKSLPGRAAWHEGARLRSCQRPMNVPLPKYSPNT